MLWFSVDRRYDRVCDRDIAFIFLDGRGGVDYLPCAARQPLRCWRDRGPGWSRQAKSDRMGIFCLVVTEEGLVLVW